MDEEEGATIPPSPPSSLAPEDHYHDPHYYYHHTHQHRQHREAQYNLHDSETEEALSPPSPPPLLAVEGLVMPADLRRPISGIDYEEYTPSEMDSHRWEAIDFQTRCATSAEEQFSTASALRRGLSLDRHLLWLCVSCALYALLALFVVYYLDWRACKDSETIDCSTTNIYAVALPLGIIYATQVFVSFRSPLMHMLRHSQRGQRRVGEYVAEMCKSALLVMHTAHCFHFEDHARGRFRHIRTVHKSSSTAAPPLPTTVENLTDERVPITKHLDHCQFHYRGFVDKTEIPSNLFQSQLVVVEGKIEWKIVSTRVSLRYERERRLFMEAHARCDQRREFSTHASLKGFESLTLCCVDPTRVPFAIRHGVIVFRLLTLLGAGWWYRVYFTGVCSEVHVCFRKHIVH